MRLAFPAAVSLWMILSPSVVRAEVAAFVLDPCDSQIFVQVFKDPTAPLAHLAHDHVIRAANWHGTVQVDLDTLSTCEIDIEIPAKDLVVDEPWLRRQVGYEFPIPADQRLQIAASMKDVAQLDATNFPTMRFTANTCTAESALLGQGAMVWVTGELDIHGRRAFVRVPMRVTVNAELLSASGRFSTTHADFGIVPYSALMGGLRNGPELRFTLAIKGARLEAEAQPLQGSSAD